MDPEHTRAAGGIVLGEAGTIAVVQHEGSSHWNLPKGHVDEGETDEEAARREIEEEAGLRDLEYLDDLGSYTRYRMLADGTEDRSELKSIHMFLFAASSTTLSPSHEMQDAKWVPITEIGEWITLPADRAWLGTVIRRIQEAVRRD